MLWLFITILTNTKMTTIKSKIREIELHHGFF